MAVEEAIYSRLSGYTNLTDLLSSTTSIYPQKADGDAPAFPYVTWELVNTIENHHAMSCPAAFSQTVQYRFHGWAESTASAAGHTLARDIANQIRKALHGFSDTDITACLYLDESSIEDPAEGIYHRVVDFEVTHTVA